jgi:hypothetical protein
MPRSTRQGWPPEGGGGECVGSGVAAGDDDVPPDGVGAGDALCTGDGPGAAVAECWPGEGAAADGIAAAGVCRGSRPLGAGCGLGERCGDVLVVRPGAGAWTRPALGSLLALDGA